MRLDKFLSNNSNYSRKEISKIIRNKNVIVNKKIIYDPSYKILNSDEILLFNKKINSNNVYYALNKPKGYICSNNNYDGKSVFDLFDKNINTKNLHIVGRLDKNTTGLVLITNDGNFTHKIKHNKNEIEKEYEVILEKEISNEMLINLNKPIKMDGKFLKPFKITNINKNKLNITLIEGKYHQIKRMFKMVGNNVIDLNRIKIGKIYLKNLNLKSGKYIKLNKDEII